MAAARRKVLFLATWRLLSSPFLAQCLSLSLQAFSRRAISSRRSPDERATHPGKYRALSRVSLRSRELRVLIKVPAPGCSPRPFRPTDLQEDNLAQRRCNIGDRPEQDKLIIL
jgi:hypothetical protein